MSVSVGVKQLPEAASVSDGFHYTLLGVCVLVAFVLGAIASGLLVSCFCGQRSQREQEPEAPLPHALSLNSLAKLNRLLDAKPAKNDITSSQIYSSGPPCRQPPAKPHATVEEELVSALPTPDSTPELPIKNLKALNSQWERSHTHNSTLQVFPTNQTLSINHTPSENHNDDTFKHIQHPEVRDVTDPVSYSLTLQMPSSYYSCLKETPETTTLQQVPLQTLPERPHGITAQSQRKVLIKMGNGVTTARQHTFNQKSNIYEIHRPLVAGGSCLTRQHSYSEPPLLQRTALVRRTASLKPQIPPKPVNIPARTLHLRLHTQPLTSDPE